MAEWKNDEELFDLIKKELYTAVVGDIMDKMGRLNQFLSPKLKPLRHDMFLAGRAFTVLESDIDKLDMETAARMKNKSFGVMLEALDDLKKNEVYVCSGSSPHYALWGELMSTRAMMLGAVGAVVNGYSRDTEGILKMNFPTFSYGRFAQDQAPRGKVIDYRVPLQIDEVLVNPGDIVIGDMDGVCVIPQEIEETVVIQALEKARGEKTVQKAILQGMSARDAFDKYGIM
ncbi:MAG: RraA family protein [Bacteroidetes bacterium]|nr:RraA family protein [Bacteroidota bacterium]